MRRAAAQRALTSNGTELTSGNARATCSRQLVSSGAPSPWPRTEGARVVALADVVAQREVHGIRLLRGVAGHGSGGRYWLAQVLQHIPHHLRPVLGLGQFAFNAQLLIAR